MKSRNIPILAIALALSQSGPPIVVLLGGIAVADLAPSPALVTLPFALMIVGIALFVIPASLLMRRIGRRKGFMIGASIGGLGTLTAASALGSGSFALFCLGTMLIGLNGAFAMQYRFAAAESVEADYAGRAVSFVLLGGIMAAFLGPEIAKGTQGWFENGENIGAFVAMAGLYLLAISALYFLKDVRAKEERHTSSGRALREIAGQKYFLIAVMAGAVSYGTMTFVMTSTPLQMRGIGGFDLSQTAGIIQSHIIAMYLPSLITGFLIERFGLFRIMASGGLILLASTFLGFSSASLPQYWLALVLLGLGWNLLFVGATVLLTHSYKGNERFKTQAANDFTIFGIQALASFSAGSVLYFSGWARINLIGFSAVAIALLVLIIQRKSLPIGRASA